MALNTCSTECEVLVQPKLGKCKWNKCKIVIGDFGLSFLFNQVKLPNLSFFEIESLHAFSGGDLRHGKLEPGKEIITIYKYNVHSDLQEIRINQHDMLSSCGDGIILKFCLCKTANFSEFLTNQDPVLVCRFVQAEQNLAFCLTLTSSISSLFSIIEGINLVEKDLATANKIRGEFRCKLRASILENRAKKTSHGKSSNFDIAHFHEDYMSGIDAGARAAVERPWTEDSLKLCKDAIEYAPFLLSRCFPSLWATVKLPKGSSYRTWAKVRRDHREAKGGVYYIAAGEALQAKSYTTCEDATFIDRTSLTFGVFDGVGSWSLEGIDASLFSRALAHECLNACLKRDLRFENNVTERTRKLLAISHERVKHKMDDTWGSSTAITGGIDPDAGILGISSLGDSVLFVLRREICGSLPVSRHNIQTSPTCETTDSPSKSLNSEADRSVDCGKSPRRIRKSISGLCSNYSPYSCPAKGLISPPSTPSSSKYNVKNESHHQGIDNHMNYKAIEFPRAYSLFSKYQTITRRVRYRTKERRWQNGAPYQLSNLPDRSRWHSLIEQGREMLVDTLTRVDIEGDSPSQAESPQQDLILQPGDLILLMTDGITDNLFDEEIEILSTYAISPEEAVLLGDPMTATPPENIAALFTAVATKRRYDGTFEAPFSKNNNGQSPQRKTQKLDQEVKGGKRDDASCIALWVMARSNESQSSDFLFNSSQSIIGDKLPAISFLPSKDGGRLDILSCGNFADKSGAPMDGCNASMCAKPTNSSMYYSEDSNPDDDLPIENITLNSPCKRGDENNGEANSEAESPCNANRTPRKSRRIRSQLSRQSF